MDSHDTDRLASMIVNGEGTVYENPAEIEFNKNDSPRSSQSYKIRKPNERERSIQRLIVLLQMSYVGAPMIYYGDEAGMWGAGDPDDRMPMIWRDVTYEPQSNDPRNRERKPDEVKFDEDLFSFYKRAIALRREHDALNHGDFAVVLTDDNQRVIVTSRRSKKETLLVAINRGDQDARVDLPGTVGTLTPIFVTDGELESVPADASPLGVSLELPPLTGAVFRSEQK
jgi:glycosidase